MTIVLIGGEDAKETISIPQSRVLFKFCHGKGPTEAMRAKMVSVRICFLAAGQWGYEAKCA